MPNNVRHRPAMSALARQQGGFTLIEIILVVMLIGAIVAFAASRILGGSDRAKVNLAKAQLQTTADKVEQFKADTGHIPAKLDELVTAPSSGATGWLGPYAKASDLKDPWGHDLQYQVPGQNGKPFTLTSLGRDGAPGGTSVDADLSSE
ncbi:type II secretion system major pseudopilin GspG [Solilutibacter silvestris]|uniref:type II secretion system major pseudopilin GspG n=1 Tax=Solilutibacter silvestris TaxID=1645665 RepID=UPI003D34637E